MLAGVVAEIKKRSHCETARLREYKNAANARQRGCVNTKRSHCEPPGEANSGGAQRNPEN